MQKYRRNRNQLYSELREIEMTTGRTNHINEQTNIHNNIYTNISFVENLSIGVLRLMQLVFLGCVSRALVVPLTLVALVVSNV